MSFVQQAKILPNMTVSDLVEQMSRCKVLGAGRLSRATSIVAEMFSDEDYTNFLSLAGPMVAGGLRTMIGDLVTRGFVDAIITTGANIVHDIIEALGYHHLVGTLPPNDLELKRKGIGRIGDIYVEQAAFEAVEKLSYKVLESIPEERRQRIAVQDLIQALGSELTDPESILVKCRNENVPIFSPAFLDSMIGLNLWTYSQTNTLAVDEIQDMNRLIQLGLQARKSGAIMIGGGVPKHHALIANIFRDGVDAAIQITMDRPEPGGLSGAPLEEAVSWGKIKESGKYATVICDATICFPIIIAAVLNTVEDRKR